MNSIKLEMIIKELQLEIVEGSKENIEKINILFHGVNRGGLELIGFHNKKDKDKIIIFGSKEIEYIKTLDDSKIIEVFTNIFTKQFQAIVFVSKIQIPKLIIKIAKKLNAVILKSKFGYIDTSFQINEFLARKLLTTKNIHATFLKIYGKGVAIIGESGIGKSETALGLIKNGHQFIVDDSLVVRRVGAYLFGESPDLIKNLIEIRGIGIIDLTKIFGESITVDKAKIDYIFRLKSFSKNEKFNRLGDKKEFKKILDIDIPVITIPVSAARNTSMLIEVAVANQIIQEKGHNGLDTYAERIKNDR